jgi:hypothetical protein
MSRLHAVVVCASEGMGFVPTRLHWPAPVHEREGLVRAAAQRELVGGGVAAAAARFARVAAARFSPRQRTALGPRERADVVSEVGLPGHGAELRLHERGEAAHLERRARRDARRRAPPPASTETRGPHARRNESCERGSARLGEGGAEGALPVAGLYRLLLRRDQVPPLASVPPSSRRGRHERFALAAPLRRAREQLH